MDLRLRSKVVFSTLIPVAFSLSLVIVLFANISEPVAFAASAVSGRPSAGIGPSVLGTTHASSADSSPWSIQSTPDVDADNGGLASVACPAPDSCVAVGSYSMRSGDKTLAEWWDGTAWSIGPTPNPSGATNSSFSGVACVSSSDCIAVGTYLDHAGDDTSLAESWDGSAWTIETNAIPRELNGFSSLSAISCVSSIDCIAVGDYYDKSRQDVPLAEVWNGTSWAALKARNPDGATDSDLTGISCQASGECVAVGDTDSGTLAELWSGTKWSIMDTPNPPKYGPTLSGVSCTSTTFCMAVGNYDSEETGTYQTLAEMWNGTKWSIQTTSDPSSYDNYLAGVSCVSATDCSATGQAGNSPVEQSATVAEVWNGSTWSVESTPNPNGSSEAFFNTDTCTTSGCEGVGTYISSVGSAETLIEEWDGTSWSIASSPDPIGVIGNELEGVSCVSSNWCSSVGFEGSFEHYQTVAEIWDGTSWSLETAPEVPDAVQSELKGVSCDSPTFCMAAGWSVDSDVSTLAESWDGTTWSVVPTPDLSDDLDELLGVSCASPTSCIAVGSYDSGSPGVYLPLTETWDGTAWSDGSVALPSGAASGQLNSVSCVSATDCTAVGNYINSSTGAQVALIEVWDGSSWSQAPGSSVNGVLSSVSCGSSTGCAAVGSNGNTGDGMFAETWDGTAWTVDPIRGREEWAGSQLNGVSCTSSNKCTAVGSYYTGIGDPLTLAEKWGGKDWTFEETPDSKAPSSIRNSGYPYGTSPESVSCTANRKCTAVGYSAVGDTDQTFAEAEG